MRSLLLIPMILVPMLAQAEGETVIQEPVAIYMTDNGSLPPPYHWEWTASLFADGAVNLTYCKGYEQEGPGCADVSGQTDPAAVAAIIAAARESGLLERPAQAAEDIMVGGGLTSGMVMLDMQGVELISSPRAEDAPRVQSVLTTMAAAIPQELITKAEKRAKAPKED